MAASLPTSVDSREPAGAGQGLGGPPAAVPPERSLLRRFAAPRYWTTWLFVLWMRVAAALPVSWSLAIHRAFGRLLYRAAGSQRRVALRNLEICFPELDAEQRAALAKRHFESLGMWLAENALGWLGPARRIDKLFDIKGVEHLEAALRKGRGVILYTGHFTPLEVCGRPFKKLVPHFAAMYSHRSNPLLEAIQARGRAALAHETIPSDNVRVMLRSLKNNAVVWYAPDQTYAFGQLVPFFHELAMTNVATSKLARLSGAAVVPFSYRRVGNGPRYTLEFYPSLEDFPTEDALADTTRLVKVLEGFIRAAPEQYQWIHKKFKGRPAELPDLYARESRRAPTARG